MKTLTTKRCFNPTLIAVISSVVLVAGCQSESALAAKPSPSKTPATQTEKQQSLVSQAKEIQSALARGQFSSIIDDIHPTRGVRFSMYGYVQPQKDKVFSQAQFAQYLKESKIRFTWGERDGIGDLLIIPLPTYLNDWVNAKTFNDAEILVNAFKGSGNSINNIKSVYPNAEIVEFYYKGSEKYDGIDWRALRLVFETYQGKRYLVAIVNDQWTV